MNKNEEVNELKWLTLVEEVRKILLEIELSAIYSADVGRLFIKRDRRLRYLVAASSCTPFVTKLRDVSEPAASWLLAITPLLALYLLFSNYSRTIQSACSLHGKCVGLLPQLKKLWRNVTIRPDITSGISLNQYIGEIHAEINTIEKDVSAWRAIRLELPDIKEIMKECKNKVPSYPMPHHETTKVGQPYELSQPYGPPIDVPTYTVPSKFPNK
jgi:hypothetical protein